MIATLRGHPIARFRRLLAGAALFALLAPTAGLVANAQLAGWTANHGHAGRVSTLATHSHPYDDHHAVRALDSDGVPTSEGHADLAFTFADDAGGVTALVLAHTPAALPAAVAPILVTIEAPSTPLDAGAARVPTPPPQA